MKPFQPTLRAVAVSLAPLCFAVSSPAIADDPSFLSVGAGYFDVFRNEKAAEFRVEFRSGFSVWIFKPFAGTMVTTDGAFYPHAGVLSDFKIGRRVVISPSAAAGAYFKGDGRNLGHVAEFRSGLEVAYRFDNEARIGLLFYHISNAGLEDTRPGTEILSLTYSVPIGGEPK